MVERSTRRNEWALQINDSTYRHPGWKDLQNRTSLAMSVLESKIPQKIRYCFPPTFFVCCKPICNTLRPCTYVSTHTCTYNIICMYLSVCVCILHYMHTNKYMHIFIYLYIYINKYIYIYKCIYKKYICMYIYICAQLFMSLITHIHIYNIHTHIHIFALYIYIDI